MEHMLKFLSPFEGKSVLMCPGLRWFGRDRVDPKIAAWRKVRRRAVVQHPFARRCAAGLGQRLEREHAQRSVVQRSRAGRIVVHQCDATRSRISRIERCATDLVARWRRRPVVAEVLERLGDLRAKTTRVHERI